MTWEPEFKGERDQAREAAPLFAPLPDLKSPQGYIADEALKAAVNVAVLLGQPLLITGEPGTGKSLLAHRIAWEFGRQEPLVFIARTTSTAIDLLYSFDALHRFLDAQTNNPNAADPANYITYQALGLAILLAMPPAMADPFLPKAYKGKGPRRSVVLIDEIDKAPRDLPNDILNEVDSMEFMVKEMKDKNRFPDFEGEENRLIKTGKSAEQAREIVAGYRATFEANRPILVLTSNDEQELPAAFLRRCVYHHIAFPNLKDPKGKKTLRTIVESRLDHLLKQEYNGQYPSESYFETVLGIFEECRNQIKAKPPATAELVAWVWYLAKRGVSPQRLDKPDATLLEHLKSSAGILSKDKEDGKRLDAFLERWVEAQKKRNLSGN